MKLSFDINKTRAIIIANADYQQGFGEVKPAKGNFDGFLKILTDPSIIGLKEANIALLFNKTTSQILRVIKKIAGKHNLEAETLIVYYIGHGYRLEDSNKLYLTGINSDADLLDEGGLTGIPFSIIKRILERSYFQRRIFILDACHSGLSTLSDATEALTEEETNISGTYILASSAGYEKSLFNTEAECTYFTGALLEVLKNGIPNEKEYMDLDTIFVEVQERLRQLEGVPEPRRKNNLKLEKRQKHFYFAKNRQFDKIEVNRKVIQALIAEGEALVLQLEFEKAHQKYRQAKKKAKPKTQYEKERDDIDSKIEACDEKWEMSKVLKIKYENLYEAKLIKVQEEIVNKNIELQGLKAKLKEVADTNKAQLQKLQDDIDAKKTVINTLNKSLSEEQNNHQKSLDTIATLQKLVEQKETQIIDLEQQLKGKQISLLHSLLRVSPSVLSKKTHQKEHFTETIGNMSFDMVFVEGGGFKIGGEHQVNLKDYYIGKYPVTQELWQAVIGNNPSHFKGDNLPVENVSWTDTQKFIQKLNEKTGKNYHLPSEAQWEFAARGGNQSKNFEFAGSDNLDEVGWYYDNSNGKTHPVGEKKPNELSIYDMSGNVWEWCQDKWHKNFNGTPNDGKAREDGSSSIRVVRGCAWYLNAEYCRVSSRLYADAGSSGDSYGFRLALSSK